MIQMYFILLHMNALYVHISKIRDTEYALISSLYVPLAGISGNSFLLLLLSVDYFEKPRRTQRRILITRNYHSCVASECTTSEL